VCYLLANERGRTYAGSTNDMRRRLRQHNGELVGGARSTHARGPWRVVALVAGFPSATTARQFEWRMHHPPTRRSGVAGRLRALGDICRLERWTARAPLAASIALAVHVDTTVVFAYDDGRIDDELDAAIARAANVTLVRH
jgi:predicted GIY-YIG superfamily endonuclease